jgi:RsiW-degrading membrane proteinase PrsW (M82 family)
MTRSTQFLVAIIGVAVIGIALAHLILGGAAVIGGSPLNPTAEGEHRFFAALFLCYGVAFLWCVPDVETKRRPLNALAGTFLVGGLARLASVAISGPPNAFYSAMLVVELALPFLLFFLVSRLRNPADGKRYPFRDRMHS